MKKSDKSQISKTLDTQDKHKTTLMIQGFKGFENFAFVDVDDKLLKEIRSAKELFRNFKITLSFVFRLKDTGNEIVEDAINIHEFH